MDLLTAEEMGEELEVTANAVRGWARRGCPHSKRDGVKRFDPGKVAEWLKKNNLTTRPGRPMAPTTEKTAEERLRLLKAKADMAEMELRRMQIELVPVAEVEKASIRKILTVKGALLGLPPAIAPQLAGLGVPEIQQRLEQEMTRICEEFARK